MKSVVHKATRDIDEQAGALPGWSQEYCQIAKGTFSGNVDYRALPGIDLFIETTNLKHEQRFTPPPGSLVIGLALPGSDPVGLGSRRVDPGSVMLMTGQPNEFYCAGHARVGAIVLERDVLLQRRVDLARVYPEVAGPASLVVSQFMLNARLQRVLCGMLAGAREPSDSILPGPLADAITNRLARVVEDLLCADEPPALPRTAKRRAETVAAACAFIQRNLETLVTVPDIARAVGVSERVLEYCFKEQRSVSPQAYVLAVRLNAARRDLRAASRDAPTVTDVAMKWGFWHLGRFAAYYKALFGETPVETLRTSSQSSMVNGNADSSW